MMEAFLDFCNENALLFVSVMLIGASICLISSSRKGRKTIRQLEVKLKDETKKQQALYEILKAWHCAIAGLFDDTCNSDFKMIFNELCRDGNFSWKSLTQDDGTAPKFSELSQYMSFLSHVMSIGRILNLAASQAEDGKKCFYTSQVSFTVGGLLQELEKELSSANNLITEFMSAEVYKAYVDWALQKMKELVCIGQRNEAKHLVDFVRLSIF